MLEASLERVAAEPTAAGRGEQRIAGMPGSLGRPDAQHGACRAGERRGSLFSSLAFAREVCGAGEWHVGDVQPGEFGGAEPGLDREQQQRVVASTGPGHAIGCGEQRLDLLLVQERDERPVGAFWWDREHALDVLGVLGMPERRVAEERMDRRQPGVPGPGAVATTGLDVIEERGDSVGI